MTGGRSGHGGVVLLSGGMDSAVTAFIAMTECREVAFLHVRYGGQTEDRERDAFLALTSRLAPAHYLITECPSLKAVGGSALTDPSIPIPEGDLERSGIPVTYVPFRNAHFLSVAVSYAEVLKYDRLYIGAVEEDGSGYPDCRRVFYDAFEQAARLGTASSGSDLSIRTPVIHMNKGEIVREGVRLGVPFALTWSCYRNGRKACGHCDSCALRLRGFARAQVPDPLEYEDGPGISGRNLRDADPDTLKKGRTPR